MSTATIPVETMPEQTPDVSETLCPRPRPERVRLTPEVQEIFDRAFRKRERKIRGEYEVMKKDFFETIEVTTQLLERCKDRISVEDECAIRDGLQAMRKEYQCQKR